MIKRTVTQRRNLFWMDKRIVKQTDAMFEGIDIDIESQTIKINEYQLTFIS